ncbi:MAG: hypothetical protein FWG46_07105 [Treponema sp.]|nr:hypothetical protein [Treponema sp.]
MKNVFLFLLFLPVLAFAEALHSPTWGFSVDLPEGYDYVDGNAKDQFSFSGPGGVQFDMLVYDRTYASMEDLVADVNRRLGNQGIADFFVYRDRRAAIVELAFGDMAGWGLCLELRGSTPGSPPPMLLALSYCEAGRSDLDLFHMSSLDSIIPVEGEAYYPGPIIEYGFPRGEAKRTPLALSGVSAMIYENDEEASQVLIEREFLIFKQYAHSDFWRQAWTRYYQFIYRDSFGRIADAASALVQHWAGNSVNQSGSLVNRTEAQLDLAKKALRWVQGFNYERNFDGSDFISLVTAVTQGRGDCDSRAMLWAIILANADIRAAMMISPNYGHAMGLADIGGTGARFDMDGTQWLVAEPNGTVDIGLIAADMSDMESWLGILFN